MLIHHLTDAEIVDYQDNPHHFVRDIIGARPTGQQLDALRAIGEAEAVAIKSGHGTGKTALEAWVIQWFLTMFPESRVPATAPTGHQLQDLLWPEIRKWSQRSINAADYEWTKTRFAIRGYEETWFAVPRSSNKSENMQGFHGDHLLFVIDEASGVGQDVMEVVEGALTGEGSRLLMCGNPTQLAGTFHAAFHQDARMYVRFTFSSADSENVSDSYPERIALKFGRDSDVYRVRVLGEFPLGAPNQFIRLDLVEAAIMRSVEPAGAVRIGVDPARYGDDESVICNAQGYHVHPLEGWYNVDGPQLAAQVARIVRGYRARGYEQRIEVRIDETGVGSSAVDALRLLEAELNIVVIPVNFGGAGDDDYLNAATVMWANVRDQLPHLQLPDDADLLGQLTTRLYSVVGTGPNAGKVVIEPKDKMKERKLPSPDRADALALALADVAPPQIIPVPVRSQKGRRLMAGYRRQEW